MVLEHAPNKIYLENEEGKTIAAVTFPDLEEGVYEINHTYVVPEMRGQKIAEKLVKAVVELARNEGKKIVPSCSYAVNEFEHKPEYADVWKR